MDHRQRYEAAAHAMQTAVKVELNHTLQDQRTSDPVTLLEYFVKHLRVGNNARASDHAALVNLLIKAGVFTMAEYEKEAADEMEREAERRRQDLIRRGYPPNITLA